MIEIIYINIFALFELLILREKKFADFFWAIGKPKKNLKFSKNIEKNRKQENCKKVSILHQALIITFFLTHQFISYRMAAFKKFNLIYVK